MQTQNAGSARVAAEEAQAARRAGAAACALARVHEDARQRGVCALCARGGQGCAGGRIAERERVVRRHRESRVPCARVPERVAHNDCAHLPQCGRRPAHTHARWRGQRRPQCSRGQRWRWERRRGCHHNKGAAPAAARAEDLFPVRLLAHRTVRHSVTFLSFLFFRFSFRLCCVVKKKGENWSHGKKLVQGLFCCRISFSTCTQRLYLCWWW